MLNSRTFDAVIMKEIEERWSPRAFLSKPVDREDLLGVLEAARYAPSCFNEQPWRFIVGAEEPLRAKVLSTLNEENQSWAKRAPVLILIAAKKLFSKNGKENPWHAFDTGTAWGFLALEAYRRGLVTHAMGGFSKKAAKELFHLSEDEVAIAVVALGYYGDSELLTDTQKEKEFPGTREKTKALILEGYPE